MKNGVAHFEIYANDVGKLKDFYTNLFDWDIQDMPGMDYAWVKTTDTGEDKRPKEPGMINGGLMRRPEGFDTSAWVNYVNVDSIEQTLEKAQKLGAKITKPKAAVPGMGWFAMLIDPQGNNFAIWKMDPQAK